MRSEKEIRDEVQTLTAFLWEIPKLNFRDHDNHAAIIGQIEALVLKLDEEAIEKRWNYDPEWNLEFEMHKAQSAMDWMNEDMKYSPSVQWRLEMEAEERWKERSQKD